jgi:cytochrome c oxidase assembly protein subunit 11
MTGKSATLLVTFSILAAMIGIVSFSVPLYNFFCKVTGYGGTTQYSSTFSEKILDQEISIRFNADVDNGLNWSFASPKKLEKLKIGENIKVEYEAMNLSSKENIGTATFNVIPIKAGPYFIKTECFCFQKQILKPNEKIKMPVVFYIDPSIADDPTMDDIEMITLSYTFFKYIEG